MTDDKPPANPKQGNGKGQRQRHRPSKKTGGGGNKPVNITKKFVGLNQDELKGVVITDDCHTPASQQYDKLHEAVVVAGGKNNRYVGTSIRGYKKLTKGAFLPAMPNPSDYTITTDTGTTENLTKKRLLEELWKDEAKSAGKRYVAYEDALGQLFTVIIGQLDSGVKEALYSTDLWEDIEFESNTITMLKALRDLCYKENNTKISPSIDLLEKLQKFVNSKQANGQSASKYVEEVRMRYDILKSSGVVITQKAHIVHTLQKVPGLPVSKYSEYVKMKPAEAKAINDASSLLLLCAIIINGSNAKSHRGLASVLKDQYSLGTDAYPMTAPETLGLMNSYKTQGKQQSKSHTPPKGPAATNPKEGGGNEEASAFITKGQEPKDDDDASDEITNAHELLMNAVADGEDFGGEFCFLNRCEDMDPTKATAEEPRSVSAKRIPSVQIPFKPRSGGGTNTISTGALNAYTANELTTYFFGRNDERIISHRHSEQVMQYMFAQPEGHINPNWLLLDSQASCNIITNDKLLSNIRVHPTGKRIKIHCNAGSRLVIQIGELRGFGTVWFQPKGIANVISLALVSDTHRITLDTSVAQAFFVHKDDGSTRRFDRMACNLYACDLTDKSGVLLAITTVTGRKELYSDLDVRRATKARKLQETIGFPSKAAYLYMIDNNFMDNCPVTRRDVIMANDIFGPNANIVKGKTVRQQLPHTREDTSPVPPGIIARYGEVTLGVDIYTVNGIRFFRTVSRHIHFRTSRTITDAKRSTLVECLTAVRGIYASRGFMIKQVFGDGEFECIRDALLSWTPSVVVHITPVNSHEPFIERDNRTSKERCRCTFAAVPFTRLPPRMVIEMVNGVDFWLNNWCSKVGVSKTKSPREIMTGICLDVVKHCKFQFGDYILAHEDRIQKNDMNP
jgi:hypothetical protein